MSLPRGRALIPAALVCLVLAGCSPDAASDAGGDAPSATATEAPREDAVSTTGPADAGGGPRGDTDGATATAGPVSSSDAAFTVALPAGWSDVGAEVEQEVELAVRADRPAGDFWTNLVVAGEEPVEDLEGSLEEAASEIAGESGEYELLDPAEVDGEPAYGYVVTRTANEQELAQTQRWVEHGGRLYVLTFSTAAAQQQSQATVLEELLAGWRWRD